MHERTRRHLQAVAHTTRASDPTSAEDTSPVQRSIWLTGQVCARDQRRGLGIVLADLATRGFHARWTCLPASRIGAPHHRDRLFLIAWPARR